MYWRAISRGRRIVGRRRTSKEVRESALSDGRGELHLGRPTDSRGTSHARFRYLGTNDFPLDETSAERPGASKTLACLSSKSPGSHRGDGLLHRSDHHLRCALLLLHHRPRSEAYREFQPSAQKLPTFRVHVLLSSSSALRFAPVGRTIFHSDEALARHRDATELSGDEDSNAVLFPRPLLLLKDATKAE